MSSSSTQICNSALIKIGAELIVSLTDNTKRAILCNHQYDIVRKKLLSSHPWNFSTKRAQLAQLGSTPDYEFDFEYQLPLDCLRVFRTKDDGNFMYRIEGRKLLTNQDEVFIEYASDLTDTSVFPEYFSEHLAHELAYDLCYAIVQSNSYKQSLRDDRMDAKRDARNFDGQEGTPRSWDISTFTNARADGHTDFLVSGRHP